MAFLSHDHQHDGALAEQLAVSLRPDVDVWVAPASIRPGASWVEAINEAFEVARFVIILVSADALRSAWVKREMATAIQLEVEGEIDRLIPIRVDDCRFPALLRGYQTLTMSDGNYDTVTDQLLDALVVAT